MPRGGIELSLSVADEKLLSFRIGAEHVPEEGVPSKLIYRVAPDGRHLAYRHWNERTLHVRDARGAEMVIARVQRFRFSADGRELAVAIGVRNGPAELVRIDLASGTRTSWGRVEHAYLDDIEWLAGGLVAHQHSTWDKHALVYFPRDGEARTIATTTTNSIVLFAAASRGTRVLYFVPDASDAIDRTGAWLVDVASPSTPARRLGGGRFAWPYTAELSPDGTQALFATHDHIFHADLGAAADGVPRAIANVVKAHSVWFSDDGTQYVWASRERMALHRDGKDWTFEPLTARGAKAEAVRFLPDGAVLVLVGGRGGERVYRWTAGAAPQLLRDTHDDVDVDLFDGRLVRLTAHSDIHRVPID